MKKFFVYLPIVLGLLFISSNAEARKHRRVIQEPSLTEDIMRPFISPFGTREHNTPKQQRKYLRSGTVIGGRPPGCPTRYCGCGASIERFGRIIPGLNLAWNWAVRFPRISRDQAGNGDAAVRRGHVALIRENLGGGNFLLHDSNSGGGRTRIHVRHLTGGYVFVRPHA